MHKHKQLDVTSFFNSSKLPLILCAMNLRIVEVNQGVTDITGYTRDEIVGKNIKDVAIDHGLNFNAKQFNALIKGEINSYSIKRKYKAKNGEKVKLKIVISLFEVGNDTYILGIIHENLKGNDFKSFFSENFDTIHKILDLNPDIHYIIDTIKNNFIYQNTSILNYFGYKNEDLKGQNVMDFLKSKIVNENVKCLDDKKDIINRANLNEVVESEYRIKTKNNGLKWIKSRSIELIRKDELNLNLEYVILQDITQEKNIEKELMFQYGFLEDITNLIPDLVFVYSINPTKILYSNLMDREFLGYSYEEWMNLLGTKIHPDYADIEKENIIKLSKLKEGEIEVFEIPYTTKSGEIRWLLSKNKLFKKIKSTGEVQILSVISDVQDYKTALENLEISQNTNDAIIKAIPDLILIVDRNGNYLDAFSGYDIKIDSSNEVVGKNVVDVIDFPTADLILESIVKCIDSDELVHLEFEYEDYNNAIIYYSNFFSKLSENKAIILVRDITKVKKAELELSNKVKLLSEQNLKLEQFISKNTELERFAYILSHDLKEPLRGVGAIAEIIHKETQQLSSAKLENLAIHLMESSDRINSMIDGVLEYSRTSSGFIRYEEVDIEKVLNSVLNDLNFLIKEKNVEIRLKDLPNVSGSEIQIRQLFQNLINNAIKFNEDEIPFVEVGSTIIEDKLTFYVKDNGIGIKHQFKDAVFKMFRRLNSSKVYSGQGLGLSICKKIVERHNGIIWVDVNQDKGSIFYFTLPLIP